MYIYIKKLDEKIKKENENFIFRIIVNIIKKIINLEQCRHMCP